jgi:hypothetical protein
VDLSAFGIKNTAVTIHGYALLAGQGITVEEFIRTKEEDICEALSSYLGNRPLNPGRKDLIILDLEPKYEISPGEWKGFSPRHLGEYDSPVQEQLIQAYIRRLSVARKVLRKKWPTVQLALTVWFCGWGGRD